MVRLPKQVRRQATSAERIQEELTEQRELRPARGRPKKPPNTTGVKVPVITGESPSEVEGGLQALSDIIGPRKPGNKRWGRVAQYQELCGVFEQLVAEGITLPSRRSLSAAACSDWLVDWLYSYGYTTDHSYPSLLLSNEPLRIAAALRKSHSKRMTICRKYGGMFERVRKSFK